MRRERHLSIGSILIGAGVGAAAMCLLDPGQGRRRRALLQDKSRHFGNLIAVGAGKISRDTRNRLAGARHRATAMASDHPSDAVLGDRVRSRLGRVTSTPRAVEVDVEQGIARLSGTIPERETRRVLRQVRRVRGIRGVENRLQPAAEETASGAGSATTTSRRARGDGGLGGESDRRSWTPTTRAAGTLAGVAALSWAARSRSPIAMAAGVTGAALIARGVTNRSLGNVIGARRDSTDPVRMRKTTSIRGEEVGPDDILSAT